MPGFSLPHLARWIKEILQIYVSDIHVLLRSFDYSNDQPPTALVVSMPFFRSARLRDRCELALVLAPYQKGLHNVLLIGGVGAPLILESDSGSVPSLYANQFMEIFYAACL
jgi:hypothetical protein